MMIELPPGVVNKKSLRSNQANWREVNLVRWEDGDMSPIGGWENTTYTGFASPIRAAHRWSDNLGRNITAFLCEKHCYVDTGEGTLIDITPTDGLAPPPEIGVGGYGDGSYGTDDYGEPRDAVNRLNLATPAYTLDNWGEELRAMTGSDGRLLSWSPQAPTDPLVAVENAPVGNNSFVVTPERHIILFGADGVRQQFKWSDQENDTNWTPSTTSKAGGFYVEPAAPIMARQITPAGTLMFTSRMAYLISYIGLPYVYAYDKVSECPPPYSPLSVVEIPEGAFWASLNGFWMYDGASALPVECPVWDWVKERIDTYYSRFKASMVHVSSKFEVWWFFTGTGATQNNCTVIYNYKYKTWYMGRIGRSCGFSTPNDPNPIMATETNVYRHESGWNYPGLSGMPWAETFTLNTLRGSVLTTIYQMLPEVKGESDAVEFKFIKRNNPSGGSEVTSSPKSIRSNGYVDVRETARDFRMRVEMVKSKNWSLGPVDIVMRKRGSK